MRGSTKCSPLCCCTLEVCGAFDEQQLKVYVKQGEYWLAIRFNEPSILNTHTYTFRKERMVKHTEFGGTRLSSVVCLCGYEVHGVMFISFSTTS